MATDKQLSFVRSLCAARTAALAVEGQTIEAVVETAALLDNRSVSELIDALKGMAVDPADPAEAARIESLRLALDTLSPRDLDFARSLIRQWEDRGALSDRQWPHVDRLAAGPAPAVTIEPGVYVVGDEFIAVYRTRNGHLAGKVWDGRHWCYESGAQRRAATGRPITADEAAAFGHATGHCVFCARELTDDRSVEVGYGPVCAGKNNLPWGTPARV